MSESTHTPPINPSASPGIAANEIAPTSKKQRRRTRGLLIGGGAVLASLVLAGGGVAIGAAIADEHDEDDDRHSAQSAARTDQPRVASNSAPAAQSGASSAAELSQIISTAAAVAEGEAIAIEAERDGSWDVTFVTAAGAETEVRVPTSGTVVVISTDAADSDDVRPAGALDSATIESLVAAALADTDGHILQLEIDDDGRGTYDIVVLANDGRTVDIDIDADRSVVSSRIDD